MFFVMLFFMMWCFVCCILVFKQKTSYEMRISDWSSDVCSSDLLQLLDVHDPDVSLDRYLQVLRYKTAKLFEAAAQVGAIVGGATPEQIGRASCRERVCQYV